MRFIGIIGEPCAGKTTITRKILEKLGTWTELKEPYILAMHYEQAKVIVLGMYDDQLFSGTDRLSMAVEPKMKEWLLKIKDQYPDHTVYFEGDRLGTLNFMTWLNQNFKQNHFFYIDASDDVKHFRHTNRGDTQTDKFLKGRETKYKNILHGMNGIIMLMNDNTDDLRVCVELIENAIVNPTADFSTLKKSKKVGLF